MNLTKNGITIVVDDAEITRMILERLNGSAYPDTLRGIAVPRIGDVWAGQGGVYAGIARGQDGAPDHHLIVGPEYDGDIDWQAAMDWAPTVEVEGRRDFTLPWPPELALMFGNVRELFQKRAYWSRKQHESDSSYAWVQLFSDGSQGDWYENVKLRARLVRRLILR